MRRLGLIVCGATMAGFLGNARRAEGQERTRMERATVTGSIARPGHREFREAYLERLKVPTGFRVGVFATGLGDPRMMVVAGNGTIFVTRPDSGDVIALRDSDGDGRAETQHKVVYGLPRVHGIAYHEYKLYLATDTAVYSVPLRGDTAGGDPWRVLGGLPDGGQHGNRTLAVGPDGMLYISIGSSCNACVETNEEHATMLRVRLDGGGRSIFARGLRNTVGWAWDSSRKELWGMDHGSDWRGDNLPPEELNRIAEGGHYGWPFCYGERKVDTRFAQDPKGTSKKEFCATTQPASLSYQAHSAPLGFVFYRGAQFPESYRGDAFVAMHGSWNRATPTGYSVVRIRFDEGKPRAIENFLTGFLLDGREAYFGRPAGIAVAGDGALLVSDDENGVIYRVSYGGGGAKPASRGAGTKGNRR
jgi:glucose/arabinose dehydrogenase